MRLAKSSSISKTSAQKLIAITQDPEFRTIQKDFGKEFKKEQDTEKQVVIVDQYVDFLQDITAAQNIIKQQMSSAKKRAKEAMAENPLFNSPERKHKKIEEGKSPAGINERLSYDPSSPSPSKDAPIRKVETTYSGKGRPKSTDTAGFKTAKVVKDRSGTNADPIYDA